MLFASEGIGDFLNKSMYVEEIAEYDQKMLEEYRQTQAEIEETKAQLEAQKEELDELKAETEAEQAKVTGMVKTSLSRTVKNANTPAQRAIIAGIR